MHHQGRYRLHYGQRVASFLAMITTQSVTHTYAPGFTLNFADWTIDTGSHWALLGASGSGKSTLLHILTGLLKPTSGHILINNTPVYELSNTELDRFRGQHIGVVFQKPHLIKSLNVKENLQLAQYFAGIKQDQQRLHEVLNSLNLYDKLNAYPSRLSQGQLQRVAIARAVINKPQLILADEPTSSLDDKNAHDVLNLLQQQAAGCGATLVVATHDQRVKERIANQYTLTA